MPREAAGSRRSLNYRAARLRLNRLAESGGLAGSAAVRARRERGFLQKMAVRDGCWATHGRRVKEFILDYLRQSVHFLRVFLEDFVNWQPLAAVREPMKPGCPVRATGRKIHHPGGGKPARTQRWPKCQAAEACWRVPGARSPWLPGKVTVGWKGAICNQFVTTETGIGESPHQSRAAFSPYAIASGRLRERERVANGSPCRTGIESTVSIGPKPTDSRLRGMER